MIILEQSSPQFVLTDPIILDTVEGPVAFEAGDPLQLQKVDDNYIIGDSSTVLLVDGKYAKSDLLDHVVPAQFELEEDDSGAFFRNTLSTDEKYTIESLTSRMSLLTESSDRKYIRVTKITVSSTGDN